MHTSIELATRLSAASVQRGWDIHSAFAWPDDLDPSWWMMSPELVSLYGTPTWDELDEAQRKRLSLYEVANLFSLTLQGERLLIGGLAEQLYTVPEPVTSYLHHVLGEENAHMVMFGTFCARYAHGVYPCRRLERPRAYAEGERAVELAVLALVVEEIGDVYNQAMARDERCHPLVRAINRYHHRDEAGHIAFGRQLLRERWDEHAPGWSERTRDRFRTWVARYIASCCRDLYNPSVYRDAGVPDAWEIWRTALASDVGRRHRTRMSRGLVELFLDIGVLVEEPSL